MKKCILRRINYFLITHWETVVHVFPKLNCGKLNDDLNVALESFHYRGLLSYKIVIVIVLFFCRCKDMIH